MIPSTAPAAQYRDDSPQAHEGPRALQDDEADLPVHDRDHRQDAGPDEVGDRVRELLRSDPAELVRGEGAEYRQRPDHGDNLEHRSPFRRLALPAPPLYQNRAVRR